MPNSISKTRRILYNDIVATQHPTARLRRVPLRLPYPPSSFSSSPVFHTYSYTSDSQLETRLGWSCVIVQPVSVVVMGDPASITFLR